MRLIVSDSIWLCSLALSLGLVYYADHKRSRYYVQFATFNDAWAFITLLGEYRKKTSYWMLVGNY